MGQTQGNVRCGSGLDIDGVESGSRFTERWHTKASSDFGVLPVPDALRPLLPLAGLERGHSYAIRGDASLSLLFALVSRASQDGAWLAMVDMPHAGLMAAHEHGVALHRVLCVSAGDTARSWAKAVGALAAGVDIVAVSSPVCTAADARRISVHARAQGSTLLLVGDPGSFSVDATFSTRTLDWTFDTHACARTVSVGITGRRVHAQRSCVVEFSPRGETTEMRQR